MADWIEPPPRPCVGCSYCCKVAPCIPGFLVYGPGKPCGALRWDARGGRYLCGVVLDEPERTRDKLKEQMAIGAGCSSPLFNEERERMIQMTRGKIKDTHAGVRLVERLDGVVSLEELRKRLTDGDVEYLRRQSVTRSLCRTAAPDGTWVYMVVNRKTKSIITILTQELAEELYRQIGRDPRELKLVPPDLKQCQGEKREGGPYSFMTLGPIPPLKRCTNAPTVVVRETKPAEDGLQGSMSLCDECLEAFRKQNPHASYSVKEIKRDG
jgi:hypothetical protein